MWKNVIKAKYGIDELGWSKKVLILTVLVVRNLSWEVLIVSNLKCILR